MPASDARKEKRKLQAMQAASTSETKPVSNKILKKKAKYGRKEMRNITMARDSRRNGSYSEDQNEEQTGSSGEDSYDEIDNEDDADDESRNRGDEKSMTYSALLTLLKNDHPEEDKKQQRLLKKKEDKANKKVSKENEDEEDEMDEEERFINEFNKSDSEEDDDEEGLDMQVEKQDNNSSNQEDQEDKSVFDSFESHFNDSNKVEKYAIEYEKKAKKIPKLLKLKERKQYPDTNIVKFEYKYDLFSDESEKTKLDKQPLDKILKSFNVKPKVISQYTQMKSTKYDMNKDLITNLHKYSNVNLQYDTNTFLKNHYQDYYILHLLNHLEKSRERIFDNNFKKSEMIHRIENGEAENLNDDEDEDSFRDQGYTRAKVLILLPTKNSCYEVINKLIHLCKETKLATTVENMKKFQDQYSSDFDMDKVNSNKPEEFKENFKGDSNDLFIIGVKLNLKSLKLYSAFEQSDIILASPLGLRKILENQSKNNKPKKSKDSKDTKPGYIKHTNDFMSSIEIVVLDKSDFLIMQNFDHINEILTKYMGKDPVNYQETDYSRIRMWQLKKQSKYVIQFLNFGKYSTPELNNLIMERSKVFKNLINGSIIFKPLITLANDSESLLNKFKLSLIKTGMINPSNPANRLRQIFMRFSIPEITEEPESRFKFFTNVLIPILINKASYNSGTLVYIPSYHDYLRVKKYFKDTSIPNFSVMAIDEYSDMRKLNRARTQFNKSSRGQPGGCNVLLYTERLHFYKRYDIKGVKNVIFYGLPSDPAFYGEILQFLVNNKIQIDQENERKALMIGGEDDNAEEEVPSVDLNLSLIRIMFCKLDLWKMERLLGLNKAGILCTADNEINELN